MRGIDVTSGVLERLEPSWNGRWDARLSTSRGRSLLILAWAASLALSLFASANYWQAQGVRGNEFDEAVYTYIGWNWQEGYWPYRDSWDRKGPLVFLVMLVRSLAFGTAPELIASQAVVVGVATAALVGGVASLLWGRYVGPLAFMTGVLLWAQKHPESGLEATPGSLIGLLTAGAVLTALVSVRSATKRPSLPLATLAGVCGGLALCVKPNAIAGIALGVLVLWFFSQGSEIPARIRAVFFLMVGVLAPIAAFLAVFYLAGALDELFDQYLFFNSVHSRNFLPGWGIWRLIERVRPSLANVGLFRPMYVVLTAFAVFAVVSAWRYWQTRTPEIRFTKRDGLILLWISLEVALFVSNGSWSYQAFPLIPPLALGCTWLVVAAWRLSSLFHDGRLSMATRGCFLAVVLSLVLSATISAAGLRPSDSAWRLRGDWNGMFRDVAAASPPGSRALFLTWDAPFMLNLLHLRAASRYEHIEPLIVRGYTSDTRWAEYLDDLRAYMPEVVVVSKFDSKTPSDELGLLDYTLRRFAQHSYPTGDLSDYPHRTQFIQFIAARYQVDYCVDDIAMCLLRRTE